MHYINKNKREISHAFSIDAEKTLGKIQHPLMI